MNTKKCTAWGCDGKLVVGLGIMLAVLCIAGPTLATEQQTPDAYDSGIYYEVRKGDTLWDISDNFYKSPWLWPGLWEQNKQITNPHWIYPGDPIRLYHDGADAGSMAKVLGPLTLRYPFIDHIGFVRKEPLPSQGHIIQFRREGNSSASAGDTVFVKASSDTPLTKGGLYHVYRTYGPVKDTQTGEDIGSQYYFTGILEIFHQDKDFYRAKLTKTFREVGVGDKLIPYTPRNPQVTVIGSPEDIDGQILFSEERQAAFGQFDVVYLNRGYENQVAPGQVYRVYYNRTSEDITVDLDVGEVLILHTEKNTATGVVLNSTEDFYAGYRFRTLRP